MFMHDCNGKKIEIGSPVEVVAGDARFQGVAVGAFNGLSGRTRVVVECTANGVEELQQIYYPAQLRVRG